MSPGRVPHPQCYVIAGPNGAGKTTFARLHLFYLWVPDPALSLMRIKDRVLHDRK